MRFEREADLRYTMQLAEVSAPVANGNLSDEDVALLIKTFEERYEQRFGKGSGFPDAGIQIITYRVRAVGQLPIRPELPAPQPGTGTPQPRGTRPVFLDITDGWEETAIYHYLDLGVGDEIERPRHRRGAHHHGRSPRRLQRTRGPARQPLDHVLKGQDQCLHIRSLVARSSSAASSPRPRAPTPDPRGHAARHHGRRRRRARPPDLRGSPPPDRRHHRGHGRRTEAHVRVGSRDRLQRLRHPHPGRGGRLGPDGPVQHPARGSRRPRREVDPGEPQQQLRAFERATCSSATTLGSVVVCTRTTPLSLLRCSTTVSCSAGPGPSRTRSTSAASRPAAGPSTAWTSSGSRFRSRPSRSSRPANSARTSRTATCDAREYPSSSRSTFAPRSARTTSPTTNCAASSTSTAPRP